MTKKEKHKIEIKSVSGAVLWTSEKETLKEAVEEAVSRDADLENANFIGANFTNANFVNANFMGANLEGVNFKGANLENADFVNAKFYGKGGTTKIKKSQIDDFFKALGVIVEE